MLILLNEREKVVDVTTWSWWDGLFVDLKFPRAKPMYLKWKVLSRWLQTRVRFQQERNKLLNDWWKINDVWMIDGRYSSSGIKWTRTLQSADTRWVSNTALGNWASLATRCCSVRKLRVPRHSDPGEKILQLEGALKLCFGWGRVCLHSEKGRNEVHTSTDLCRQRV